MRSEKYNAVGVSSKNVLTNRGQQITVQNIPHTHKVVLKSTLSTYKKQVDTLRTVIKKLEQPQYQPTDRGKQLYGTAIAFAPKASQLVLQTITPIIVASSIANSGLPVNLDKLFGSQPSMNTMPSIVADSASDEMQRAIVSIRQNPAVYVIADKANSKKKGATSASFPKMLAWTNKQRF